MLEKCGEVGRCRCLIPTSLHALLTVSMRRGVSRHDTEASNVNQSPLPKLSNSLPRFWRHQPPVSTVSRCHEKHHTDTLGTKSILELARNADDFLSKVTPSDGHATVCLQLALVGLVELCWSIHICLTPAQPFLWVTP